MTKEQEKTLYRLNKDIENPLACGDITIVNIKDLKTALNMLKEKDKEIEKYKKQAQVHLEASVIRTNKFNAERKKKDKIIDLMARAIDNYDSQLVINTFKDKEHVKEYFKELAERKSEE